MLDSKVKGVRPPGAGLRENIFVGLRAQVDDELEGPVVIGENVRVDEGAKISPYSIIADNVVICAGATAERSVVAEGTYIGEGADLIGTLVGRNSYVYAENDEGSPEELIKEYAELVKSLIEDQAMLSS